ncbi:serine hydrolase domain-containing protein [Pseudoalteromonas luteoviolacea]|uniref:Beta-lactamase n=1 Tax=Pseudoalteromonas luteoviolacea (strain 2ta16) TaxID=1353533 RepID=V4HLD9_PSEL2|nr:serine hydrolase domain-containing protein [Pseudoalteromonas luteoviolacea]ESP90588.1 beta-lactamase [Pseudoalteromonas luteoviolacea 2ta16]KZN41840.1 hypothetical protein N483_14305 [Pseudoalteromonas luteoviolacea NCIMB 1944]
MKKGVLWLVSTLGVMSLWAALNFYATTQGWFIEKIAAQGDTQEFVTNIKTEVDKGFRGNVAMLMMEQGEVIATHHVSKGELVNTDSVFGVASLGKWVAAVAAMQLAEQGKLDLDAPVSNYLTRWQLPPSEFDNDGVTVRRLLSHTAGITDGLGHDGFPVGTPVQPLVEHLTLAADREPDKSGKVAVGMQPGTRWQYSGGSYNLLQLLIEEISGQGFAQYMRQAIFLPLGMTNTGYSVDRSAPQTAQYFGENQTLLVYPNYTSLAATGLYSTTSDLAKFVRSQIPTSALNTPGKRILTDQSLLAMRQPIGQSGGLEIWGAGVMLYADNNHGSFVLGHGGRSPMLNATARMNPKTGNAFIMFQTGNKRAFASNMATKWTNWEAGTPDMFQLRFMLLDMFNLIAIGCGVILLLSALGFMYSRKRVSK